jgi:Ser/Thr protein kinase RdoA (MazF antagonist)
VPPADGARRPGDDGALHAFHGSGTQLGRRHGPEDELRPLEARILGLVSAQPSLSDAALDGWRWLHAGLRSLPAWRERPVHRDLYHDNILVSTDGLAFVDLDDVAMGEPALDVANLTAHLHLLAAQEPGAKPALDGVRRAFVDAYSSLDPELDPGLVVYLEVATLLRLAHIHQPRSRGSEVARALITEMARLMDVDTGMVS